MAKAKKSQTVDKLTEKSIVTPIGILRYAWLDKPQQSKKFNSLSHNVTVSFDSADAGFRAMKKTLLKLWSDWLKKVDEDADTELDLFQPDPDDNNRTVIKFRSAIKKGSNKTGPFGEVYGPTNNKLDVDDYPWKGSEVRISFAPAGYRTGLGIGMSLWLNGVMVFKQSKGTRRSAQGDFADYAQDPAETVTGDSDADDIPEAGSVV